MALVWHEKANRFADKFCITHEHSFGTDTQHCRTMSSSLLYFLLNPEQNKKLCFKSSQFFFCVKFFIILNKFSIISKNLIEFLILISYVIFFFFLLINRSCGGGDLTIETRIYHRWEFKESLGINFLSPFQPERELKVHKSCKCSQVICSRVH